MTTPNGEPGAAARAAAASGDCATLELLLPIRGPARFTRDTLGRTAIHLAAANGKAAALRMLLQIAAPQEVDARDGAGSTALHRAAAEGHEETVRALLAKGARVDSIDTMHANTALHECAWKGHSRTVRLLCAAGAPMMVANAGGFAALHLACQNGHNQSCRELLLAGADPDLRNGYGDSALHTAARYGHAGVTRILISAKCKVSERNKNGDTALHISAAMGRRKLTRILLEAGCDKSIRNKQSETAQCIARRKDLTEIVDILEENAALLNKVLSGAAAATRRSRKEKSSKRRSKSKVRFEGKIAGAAAAASSSKDTVDKPGTVEIHSPKLTSINTAAGITSPSNNNNNNNGKNWSPYGCHYYPDPEAFPSPNLDSLPTEPLKKGEQYYLDLAGNICKGPVGVGYTCYCAPLFRHLEAKIERDKRELVRAQTRLGQRVAGLEQKLNRGAHGRRSERIIVHREPEMQQMTRSRSLEMLDKAEKSQLQATRSMDELEPHEGEEEEEEEEKNRPSVKELVARIQQKNSTTSQQQHHDEDGNNNNLNSESSDDEEEEDLRIGVPSSHHQRKDLHHQHHHQHVQISSPNNNEAIMRLAHYENLANNDDVGIPARSRSGVYSPNLESAAPSQIHDLTTTTSTNRYLESMVKLQQHQDPSSTTTIRYPYMPLQHTYQQYDSTSSSAYHHHHHPGRFYDEDNNNDDTRSSSPPPPPNLHQTTNNNNKYYVDQHSINARLAKLRVLENAKNYPESKNPIEGSSRMLDPNNFIIDGTTTAARGILMENPHHGTIIIDTIDRDTNNDSGYSTKVYGSSKGNSPSLSGQIQIESNECLGASSLV